MDDKWNSVAQRVPFSDKPVLVYLDYGIYAVAQYGTNTFLRSKTWYTMFPALVIFGDHVKYWADLPDCPGGNSMQWRERRC